MVPNITLPINHPESTPGIRPIIREVLRLHNPYILCIKKKKNSETIEHPKIDINITKVLNPFSIDFWYNPEIKDVEIIPILIRIINNPNKRAIIMGTATITKAVTASTAKANK